MIFSHEARHELSLQEIKNYTHFTLTSIEPISLSESGNFFN